jgi:hypothetical protein
MRMLNNLIGLKCWFVQAGMVILHLNNRSQFVERWSAYQVLP